MSGYQLTCAFEAKPFSNMGGDRSKVIADHFFEMKGYVMLEIKNAVVGTKQVLKAIQAGSLQYIYLAEDVEPFLKNKVRAAAEEKGLPVKSVPTMKELGESCKIDVSAACVGVRHQEE